MATRLKSILYSDLNECLASLFDDSGKKISPSVVINNAGLDTARVKFNGIAIETWDSALSLAQEDEKIKILVEVADKLRGHDFLKSLIKMIDNGEAFVTVENLNKAKEGILLKDGKLRLFFNYDLTDRTHKEQFEKYLKIYTNPVVSKNPLPFEFFDMQAIAPGEGRLKTIKEELCNSDMVLLFMSMDFFSKEEGLCYSLTTMAHDLKKKLIPIIAGEAPYERINVISEIQAIPYDDEPLDQKANNGAMGKVYNDLTALIVKVAEKLLKK